MSVANLFNTTATNFAIHSARLTLRLITRADRAAWLRVRHRNYEYLRQWDPSWSSDSLSYLGMQQYEDFTHKQYEKKEALIMVIAQKDSPNIIGGCEVVRLMDWPVRSAMVGYWIDEQQRGQGYMPEALKSLCRHLFVVAGLRKIDAAVQPTNYASQRVMDKVGFMREGLASDFAEINGTYQPHLLYGLQRAHGLVL